MFLLDPLDGNIHVFKLQINSTLTCKAKKQDFKFNMHMHKNRTRFVLVIFL